MAKVEQTRLPGVGIRYDFVTKAGGRVGVISYRDGSQELLVFDEEDPDRCAGALHLEAQDSRTLAELLGPPSPAPAWAGERQGGRHEERPRSAGITVESVSVEPGCLAQGHTIADTALRQRTGASIVAVLRAGATLPAYADTRLESGDIAVVVGTRDDVAAAVAVLCGAAPRDQRA